MKLSLIILLFISTASFSQVSVKDILGTWDGGQAFAGEYEEKPFEISFYGDSVVIHYGPNYYHQYKTWQIEGDTLTIVRKDKDVIHYPKFCVKKINHSELQIEAINWPAVYITHSLSSPYQNAKESDYWDNSGNDLTHGGVLRIELDLKKSKN